MFKIHQTHHAVLYGIMLSILLCVPGKTPGAESDAKSAPIKEKRIKKSDREHWSFRVPVRPKPPVVKNADWVRNPIDQFILARLEKAGLQPMPQAKRATLIRRLYFDLTGLPPTPKQVAQFEMDQSPDAYQQVVDQLLSSPAYGQRWAQYWLDLARFAETDGFEHDKTRPEAWRYRDWVIEALNADMPYDRFVRLQIAGDETQDLAGKAETKDTRRLPGSIATGFLLAGPDMPDINDQDERRHTKLNEMTATVGQVFLGLTMQCAQCHDHKYDPISQADFYRMRALFEGIVPKLRRNKPLGMMVAEPDAAPPPSYLMVRGDFRRRGALLEPGFVRVVNSSGQKVALPGASSKTSGRRTALADWLTQPDTEAGGLLSRVIVNRVWQQYFGRGLVGTSGDFGFMGDEPSHPKLLDFLATELPRQRWSLKALHRLIVRSATYRQMSRPITPVQKQQWKTASTKDPNNHLLWHMNRKRVGGETLRDAILAVAGKINLKHGGPSVRPALPDEVVKTLLRSDHWKKSATEADRNRRSIYVFSRRNLVYPMFHIFDRPDAHQCSVRRPVSTTATQALFVLNSKFSLEMARHFAGLLLKQVPDDERARIDLAYRMILSRPPTDAEYPIVNAYVEKLTGDIKASRRKPKDLALPSDFEDISKRSKQLDPQRAAAWTNLCLAMFNLNEFLYID